MSFSLLGHSFARRCLEYCGNDAFREFPNIRCTSSVKGGLKWHQIHDILYRIPIGEDVVLVYLGDNDLSEWLNHGSYSKLASDFADFHLNNLLNLRNKLGCRLLLATKLFPRFERCSPRTLSDKNLYDPWTAYNKTAERINRFLDERVNRAQYAGIEFAPCSRYVPRRQSRRRRGHHFLSWAPKRISFDCSGVHVDPDESVLPLVNIEQCDLRKSVYHDILWYALWRVDLPGH